MLAAVAVTHRGTRTWARCSQLCVLVRACRSQLCSPQGQQEGVFTLRGHGSAAAGSGLHPRKLTFGIPVLVPIGFH